MGLLGKPSILGNPPQMWIDDGCPSERSCVDSQFLANHRRTPSSLVRSMYWKMGGNIAKQLDRIARKTSHSTHVSPHTNTTKPWPKQGGFIFRLFFSIFGFGGSFCGRFLVVGGVLGANTSWSFGIFHPSVFSEKFGFRFTKKSLWGPKQTAPVFQALPPKKKDVFNSS